MTWLLKLLQASMFILDDENHNLSTYAFAVNHESRRIAEIFNFKKFQIELCHIYFLI